MAHIDRYLSFAVTNRASDLHFSAGEPARVRIDGDLVALSEGALNEEQLQEILYEILNDTEREKLNTNKNLDKSYSVENVGFFRVNIFWTRRGIAAVLRTIPQKIPTMQDLNLPEAILNLTESPKGLVLVTGPTGSGKSTTLAAMIDHINTNHNYHILTAEDPVEFVHQSKESLVNQREIGANCQSFADALKYALREDPDVILVGEMRDLETIGLALTAAETGHLVFGTLHTRGAGASVDRIIDSFPANQQAMIRTMLSESLVGVVSQSLLKRADGKGRIAAFEILIVNHAISNLIREGKTFQITSIIQTGRREGMILMDQHLIELVEKGLVTMEEALPYMEDPAQAQARLKKAGGAPQGMSTPQAARAPAAAGASAAKTLGSMPTRAQTSPPNLPQATPQTKKPGQLNYPLPKAVPKMPVAAPPAAAPQTPPPAPIRAVEEVTLTTEPSPGEIPVTPLVTQVEEITSLGGDDTNNEISLSEDGLLTLSVPDEFSETRITDRDELMAEMPMEKPKAPPATAPKAPAAPHLRPVAPEAKRPIAPPPPPKRKVG
jgi:twitching motility protein PilT